MSLLTIECGSSARATQALTATRVAPAFTAAEMVSGPIPPNANAGNDVAENASRTNSSPANRSKAFVVLGNVGPTPM